MILPTRSSIRLNRGYTYKDYVIRRNAGVPYYELCHALKISFEEAKASYDKTFNRSLEEIGEIKEATNETSNI